VLRCSMPQPISYIAPIYERCLLSMVTVTTVCRRSNSEPSSVISYYAKNVEARWVVTSRINLPRSLHRRKRGRPQVPERFELIAVQRGVSGASP
jgi:hypothetical protein